MDALLTMIALWLSFNFSLPASAELPRVETVARHEILFRRYRAFTAEAQKELLAALSGSEASADRRELVAIYDDTNLTIYLPLSWSGANAAELSVLVHEMVHHGQQQAGLRYECPAQREALAYQAQEKWLRMFGKNLLEEFGIDELTLKVSTSCGF